MRLLMQSHQQAEMIERRARAAMNMGCLLAAGLLSSGGYGGLCVRAWEYMRNREGLAVSGCPLPPPDLAACILRAL